MRFVWYRHLTAQGGATDALAFLLGQVDPNSFSGSYIRQWRDQALGDTHSIDSDCVLKGRLPSYSAIERKVRALSSPGSRAKVLGTQRGLPEPL